MEEKMDLAAGILIVIGHMNIFMVNQKEKI